MSHLQIKFAFRLFWSILGEIHWKFLFLNIKLTLSERSSDVIGKFVFLNKLEKGKIHRKIWIICKQNLLYEAIKWDIYKQKKISPQNETHTAKLCFSVILKHFWGNSLKNSLFIQKLTISERSSEILRKNAFLTTFLKEKSQRKIWIWCKQLFCTKQLNGAIINKNFFSRQNEPHIAKLFFHVVLKHFWDISLKTSLFSPKRDYLRKEHKKTQKVCFS